jgi:hypothetical protein
VAEVYERVAAGLTATVLDAPTDKTPGIASAISDVVAPRSRTHRRRGDRRRVASPLIGGLKLASVQPFLEAMLICAKLVATGAITGALGSSTTWRTLRSRDVPSSSSERRERRLRSRDEPADALGSRKPALEHDHCSLGCTRLAPRGSTQV